MYEIQSTRFLSHHASKLLNLSGLFAGQNLSSMKNVSKIVQQKLNRKCFETKNSGGCSVGCFILTPAFRFAKHLKAGQNTQQWVGWGEKFIPLQEGFTLSFLQV